MVIFSFQRTEQLLYCFLFASLLIACSVSPNYEATDIAKTEEALQATRPTKPTNTVVPSSTPFPSALFPTSTLASTPDSVLLNNEWTLTISEIAIFPKNDAHEFIELFNYGSSPININGLCLATNRTLLKGSRIVAFDERFFSYGLFNGQNLRTSEALLPPNSFAIIVSPKYAPSGDYIYAGLIVPETLIMTVEDGDYLGSESSALVGQSNPSVLVMYHGDLDCTKVEQVISTYGSPNLPILSAGTISDDQTTSFPFLLKTGSYGVQRVDITCELDQRSNWIEYSYEELSLGSHSFSKNGCN